VFFWLIYLLGSLGEMNSPDDEARRTSTAALIDRVHLFFEAITTPTLTAPLSTSSPDVGMWVATLARYDVTVVDGLAELRSIWDGIEPSSSSSPEARLSVSLNDGELGAAASISHEGGTRIDVLLCKVFIRHVLAASRSVIDNPHAEDQYRAKATFTALLCGCSMNYHWWSCRKRQITAMQAVPSEALRSLTVELNVTSFVAALHPKAPDAWEHRRFLWARFLSGDQLGASTELLRYADRVKDIDLSHSIPSALRRHPRGYPAWQYRKFLVSSAATIDVPAEVRALSRYIGDHPQEASAGFYLCEHLRALTAAREESVMEVTRPLIDECLGMSQRLLRRWSLGLVATPELGLAKAHEACWQLRRGLVSVAMSLMNDGRSIWRGWTVLDELELVEAHCNVPLWGPAVDDDAGQRERQPEYTKALLARSDVPCYWPMFAASHGQWLCRVVGQQQREPHDF
jgi:hypothetical protein